MEKKEDETFNHGFVGGEPNEYSMDSTVLVFRNLDLVYRRLEEELTDHKRIVTDLRRIAIRCLNNGNVEPLNILEEEVKKMYMLIGGQKGKVEELTRILNNLEMEFTKLGLPSFAEFEEGYDEKLQEKIRVQREEAKQGRENRNKSFMEILQQLDQSDIEGRKALNGIKAVAMKAGIDLSFLLVDYFLLILYSRPEELERKIETVKNTIQSASLGESSVIIDMFVSVVEFVGREMMVNPKGSAKKDVKNEDLSYGKRETDFLGMIFFEVFNLEIAFVRLQSS